MQTRSLICRPVLATLLGDEKEWPLYKEAGRLLVIISLCGGGAVSGHTCSSCHRCILGYADRWQPWQHHLDLYVSGDTGSTVTGCGGAKRDPWMFVCGSMYVLCLSVFWCMAYIAVRQTWVYVAQLWAYTFQTRNTFTCIFFGSCVHAGTKC